MIRKDVQKKEAVALRRSGHTYREILEEVPVAKSTLSLWLRDVGLSQKQVQKMTVKKRAAQLRGGARRREMRIMESEEIYRQSAREVGDITKRELFLLGVALYWAEGAKAKEYRPSVGIDWANSDPAMVRLFMLWLRTFLHVSNTDMMLTIHLHDNRREKIKSVEEYWLNVTNLPRSCLTKPIYKTHNPKTKRKNIGDSYVGLVAVSVRSSTKMNRRIQGWVYGIISALK